MKAKKGQNLAISNIITLIVGVGVSVMVLIFIGSLGGQTYNLSENDINAIGNNIITNEAFNATNVTEKQLSHNFVQTNTVTVFNTSSGLVIGLGNFTIDYDDGAIILKTTATPATSNLINGNFLSINYTWGNKDVRDSVKNSVTSGFEALEQTGDYLPIIVLAVVISLVLFLILGFTAFGNKGNSGQVL